MLGAVGFACLEEKLTSQNMGKVKVHRIKHRENKHC